MRTFSKAALMATALLAGAPALAQVWSSGPVSNQTIPGQPMVWSPGPVSNQPIPGQPQVWSPGPVSNQPIPGAPMVSAYPPYYNQPPAIAPPDPGFYAGPGANAPRNAYRGSAGGRWYGGTQAPGGWGAYRRPSRGWTLPGYWMGSGFRIPNYHSYGLMAPPAGYFWVRYYDDAVLVDGRGRVSDWSNGIAWGDADAWAGDGYAGAWSNSQSYSNVTVGGRGIQPVDPDRYYYGQQYPGGYASPAALPPAMQFQGYPACANPCAGYGGYGYGSGSYYGAGASYGGGYYYGAPTVTTIVIQSAPVVTTTTTVIEEQVYEEEVVSTSYVIAAPTKRRLRKTVPRSYRKGKPRCRC